MNLNPELLPLLPKRADVDFYKEHGWYVAPKVLSDELIDEAQRGAERYWAGERDWKFPIRDGFRDWKPGDGDTIRVNEFIALQSRELRTLVEQPIIGAIAARLAGTSEVRLWESELIYKPPQARAPDAAVGWHTDRAYWLNCSSENMVSVWIPFHDTPTELGPLMVVDGSHRWTDVDHKNLREFRNTNIHKRGADLVAQHPGAQMIPFQLKKGQVSFHHINLLHCSGFNVSDRPRISVALHFQDKENRFRQFETGRGEPFMLTQDRLCRRTREGIPDYEDPYVCPVFWRE